MKIFGLSLVLFLTVARFSLAFVPAGFPQPTPTSTVTPRPVHKQPGFPVEPHFADLKARILARAAVAKITSNEKLAPFVSLLVKSVKNCTLLSIQKIDTHTQEYLYIFLFPDAGTVTVSIKDADLKGE